MACKIAAAVLAVFCIVLAADAAPKDTMSMGMLDGMETFFGRPTPNGFTPAEALSFCQSRGLILPGLETQRMKNFYHGLIDPRMWSMVPANMQSIPGFWLRGARRGTTCPYAYSTRTEVGIRYQACNTKMPGVACEGGP